MINQQLKQLEDFKFLTDLLNEIIKREGILNHTVKGLSLPAPSNRCSEQLIQLWNKD